MATIAAVMMLGLRRPSGSGPDGPVRFDRVAAIVVGATVGLGAGLVGAGGAFFLIPAMLYGLKVPVRVTVGTSLAVVAASSLAGLVGKAVTGQVDWLLAAGLVAGALPGSRLGAYVSQRTHPDRLVVYLGVAIAAVAGWMWLDILLI
jgi:uncharacterized membrane protein YfcA